MRVADLDAFIERNGGLSNIYRTREERMEEVCGAVNYHLSERIICWYPPHGPEREHSWTQLETEIEES